MSIHTAMPSSNIKASNKNSSKDNKKIDTDIEIDSLLHLLHLVSPALPVGAYAYSQGLETAVENQWVNSFETSKDWIGNVMSEGLGCLDLPVLLRVTKAWQTNDIKKIDRWNNFLLVSRESKELLLEDTQMGEALLRLLADLDVKQAAEWQEENQKREDQLKQKPSFVTMFALAATHWKVDESSMLKGFVWSWLENQVAAAIKLVPLGQTDAQKLLIALMPNVNKVVEKSYTIEAEDIGSNLPRLAIGSMQHETQYSRLFRS
ncbi:MAG: urease accessory protein UreF [Cellvibrionaceae bacterium]